MRAGLARTEARVVLVALCAMAVVLAHAAPAALHDACMLPERSAPAPGEAVRVSLHDSAVFPGPPVLLVGHHTGCAMTTQHELLGS